MAPDQNETRRTIYTDFFEYEDADLKPPADPVRRTFYAVDTNILLNLYKYTRPTAEDLIRALRQMESVLFVPHQVLAEFWAQLETVRKGAHHREALGKIETAIDGLERDVNTWLRRTGLKDPHESSEQATTEDGPQSAGQAERADREIEKARECAENLKSIIEGVLDDTTGDDQWILKQLEDILQDRIGGAPSVDERSRMLKEFEERQKNDIPPGTRDTEKRNGKTEKSFGDYFIWKQCINEGTARSARAGQPFDLTLVTQDLKDDWTRSQNPQILARRELVREYHDATQGGIFRINTFTMFIETAVQHFDATITDESKAQVMALSRTEDAVWTTAGVVEYLNALKENHSDQWKVLLAAYALHNDNLPPISVDEAKRLVDRDHMASFSKPYKSILSRPELLELADIESPMIHRTDNEDATDKVYVLQGEPEGPLGEVVKRDSELNEVVNEQLEILLRFRSEEEQ